VLSPALELVRTAASLNRLDELEARITEAQKQVADPLRDGLAMHLLVSVARGDDAASIQLLANILTELKKLDGATPAWQRHAEFTAVVAALQRPNLQKHVLPIAEMLVENQHSNYQTIDWERRVRWLRAKAHWQNDPAVAKLPMGQIQPVELKQWVSVSQPTAATRGLPQESWQGRLFHRPSRGRSLFPLAADRQFRSALPQNHLWLEGDSRPVRRHSHGRAP
jgi:hypothetical protein